MCWKDSPSPPTYIPLSHLLLPFIPLYFNSSLLFTLYTPLRMSCNGCRVLRKGCSDDCTLRPCLHWINSPQSQANATIFLAKFYGRAGLINLINQGPDLLRPAIFKSLLYEACGRIINPIHGSAGLVGEGRWELCTEAVEAVLKGMPITPISTGHGGAPARPIFPLKGSDIRHFSKDSRPVRRVRTRNRFKRSASVHGGALLPAFDEFTAEPAKFSITGWDCGKPENNGSDRAPSHDSLSVETVEPSLVNRECPVWIPETETWTGDEDGEPILELTLGVNPARRAPAQKLCISNL